MVAAADLKLERSKTMKNEEWLRALRPLRFRWRFRIVGLSTLEKDRGICLETLEDLWDSAPFSPQQIVLHMRD